MSGRGGRAARAAAGARRLAGTAWSMLRAWCGDSAYEAYLRRAREGAAPALTREQFWLDTLQRRYSRPTRCC